MTDRCGCNVRLRVEGGEEIKLSASEARVIEGISPTVDVERVEGGAQITVEDYRGEPETVIVYDGEQGEKGDTGESGTDGFSPTVDVEETVGGYSVTITDADGSQTFEVMNGEQGIQGETGPAGSDGHSPVVTASKTGKTTTILVDGTAIATINDGNDGADGAPGADGQDYVLTAQDKADIAEIVLSELPSAVGVEF